MEEARQDTASYDHHVAVITGGGSGLGQALAWELAGRGVRCLVVGRRLEALKETQARFPQMIDVVSSDIATEEVRKAVLAALSSDSKVRFLVQNAAMLGPVHPLLDVKPEEWLSAMDINVNAQLFLTQLLVPHMRSEGDDLKSPSSRILHVGSGAASKHFKAWGTYCVSKAAFFMLHEVLKIELEPLGIRVSSVKPGVVDTPMQAVAREAPESDPLFGDMKVTGQLRDPRHVAKFLAYILLDTSDSLFTQWEWDIRSTEQDHTKHWDKEQ